MTENNIIKFGLCFMMLVLIIIMWVVQSSSLTSFSGIFAFVFLLKCIYEYKTPKEDRIPLISILDITLFVTIFGLGLILLLQSLLSWTYSPTLSFIYGLSGFIFTIAAIYDYKTRKNS